MSDTTITNFGTSQAPAYVGVVNIFLLTLFIMAIAPGSGGQLEQSGFKKPGGLMEIKGHINPLITFSTMVVGLTGFSRGISAISHQS